MKHTTRLLILAAAAVGAAGMATAGWAYWSASGSGTATAQVGTWKTDTTTSVVSSGSPSLVGEEVTYTASVMTASGSGTPTGNVVFFDGGSPIAACGGSAGGALSGSVATCAQTYSAVGGHAISAQYLGDTDFSPSLVSASITQVVNKGVTATSLTVTGSPAVYGSENTVVFTSAVTTAVGTPTGTVAIKHGGATLCEISLPATSCSPAATALFASPTAYVITAVYSGDDTYLGSTSPEQNLTVRKATPVITWIPAAITYGTPLGSGQLNATANTAGTFTYSPPAGTVLGAGSQSLDVSFAPNDTTNFDSTTAGRTLTVSKADQTIAFTSTAPTGAKFGGSYTVAATATSGLTVSFSSATTAVCTASGSTASFVGVGQCTINANQAGNTNYNAAAQAQQTFAVGKADQTVTFTSTAPTAATFAGSYTVAATATSGLSVTFGSATTAVCTVSGSTVSFVGIGNCTVNANQAGNSNWNAAAQVQQTFAVAKADQTISFTSTAPAAASIGGSYTPTATATSQLTVTFSSATPSICSVSSGTVNFSAAGTCTVNANQAGNTNWNAAAQVQQSFLVSGPLTITGSARDGGNQKHKFSGTGGTPGATVTVSVCETNDFPSCAVKTTATATVAADGTWTTGQSSSNIRGLTTYYARAEQDSPLKTSAVFQFPL